MQSAGKELPAAAGWPLLFYPLREADRITENRRFASILVMICKLKSRKFRLYSRKKDASMGKRRNLGTFSTLEQARQHEREVQYFKRH